MVTKVKHWCKCRIREKRRDEFVESTVMLGFYTMTKNEAREIAKVQLERADDTEVLDVEVYPMYET